MTQGTASPEVLRRSRHLSTFAHQGAVYLYHDLYGYLLQMSPDLLGLLDAFTEPSKASELCVRYADAFEGQAPQQFVDIFYQHACLVEPDDDEVAGIWPMIAFKGKWNVWRRHGDRVTLWTAWGDRPVARVELDPAETAMWDAFDGEVRLNELRARHDARKLQALVVRLAHSDVQAIKLSAFPASMYAKRPAMAPRYLASTMPYRAWRPGEPLEAPVRDVATDDYYQDVADADAQFDHRETTLSHLFREPHPALGGRTYGGALVDALAAQGRLPARAVRVLEIGAGLGYVARAVCEALAGRGLEVSYTIQELSPALAAAQRTRTAGLPVTVREGDVLTADLPADAFDLIIANEMVGDLPAEQHSRTEVGMDADGGGEVDPVKLAGLGRAGQLVDELGISLTDAPEPFYLLTGALELVIRIARWLAPDGTAIVTEFGERAMWPRLSSHLDHPELSTHFGHLLQAAQARGLGGQIDFVMDLIDLDRSLEGLATTRSHFRALRAMLADAGVDLPKLGYTRELLAARLAGKIELAEIGELRWDRIEDRLMGLVPHEFKALVVRKPSGN
ncbi:MAG: methyltransferase domain-containing protein [Kofleriaceae bacterium]|nr:methyltransferase domain-containing protein [Kofleriaceae bacterium]MCL4223405.1 methyltransferase domain-containing protein [Myxococcales bacterium]